MYIVELSTVFIYLSLDICMPYNNLVPPPVIVVKLQTLRSLETDQIQPLADNLS